MTTYEQLPFHRQFRIAMTDEERRWHTTGGAVRLVNGIMPLNTRSLADDPRYQPTRCLACGGGLRADGKCSRCGEFFPGWKD